jgi:DNA-binding SARP family transcriptional activator
MEMQVGSSDAVLRLKVLGGADATVRPVGQPDRRLTTTKGLALLCYLALNGGRPTSRAILADLLWGDRIDRQARQSLRQCLMSIRRDLGPAAASVLIVDERCVALEPESVEVDALQFLNFATATTSAKRLNCLQIPWGPFLDGFHTGAESFDDWAAAERNRLATIAVRTFSELTEICIAEDDGERAILAMERLVSIDPTEEERHRRLLSLEARYRGADARVPPA